ncbi:MAG: DNA translocase FtsK [Anaerolineae bacterium]|nr:MAG: DNA translocase FtsK [Anaerolineae bacterium]
MATRKNQKKGEQTPLPSMARPIEEGQPLSPGMVALTRLWTRFGRFGRDILGIILLVAALITLLALIGLGSGAWITPWAGLLRSWFGWGSALAVVAMGITGLLMLYQRRNPFDNRTWGRVIALEVSAFGLLALLAVGGGTTLDRAEQGLDGGVIGWGIAIFLGLLFSPLGEGVGNFLRGALLLGVVISGGLYGLGLFRPLLLWLERQLGGRAVDRTAMAGDQPAVSIGVMDEGAAAAAQGGGPETQRRRTYIPPEFRKQFKVENIDETPTLAPTPRDSRLPSLDFLSTEQSVRPSERHINQAAGLIEKTLAEFGVPAKVVGFQVGPTVTQFAVEPGYFADDRDSEKEAKQKVRVSQIAGLQRDLALALSAKRLRIQAPVPGKSYVGIEVPNEKSSVVRLRAILESDAFHSIDSPLLVALGRDVSGQPLVADLSRMPHLLIAGTTGSGKSVCIAALTICLAMNNTPEQLQLVMIDPKMVELVRFNGLPHLLGKVETNLERINGVLRWVVVEMERRYKLLEDLRARDIESYNRKAARRKEVQQLPRMVVMIDELADLMMNSAESTEATLVRVAQMARATGIHLVVATQRPSTDVVTGLIKANFPARLSFAVASSIDSRVILDMVGAESLLGRGDMLFLPPEVGTPIRSQGVMVTDQEVERLITYWQEHWEVTETDSPWERMLAEDQMLSDRDDLVRKAIALVQETGKASASMFQRRLRIGYPRAARLVDELEDLGIVGPPMGGGREREVLMDLENPEGGWATDDSDPEDDN